MTELRKVEGEALHEVATGARAVRRKLPRILTRRHSKRWFIVHGLASLSMLVYIVADHAFGFTLAILGHGIWLWVDDEPAPVAEAEEEASA